MQTKSKDTLESLLDGRHHLQFTRLVRLLSGPPQAVADKVVSLKDANHITFQVDSQDIMNCEMDLHFQNKRLANNKRAAVKHVLNFSAFKRCKLDKVGNHTTFDTDRKKYESELEAGGMSAGFSNISGSQPMYNVTLTSNTAPHYLLGSEVQKIDTTVTRSYDRFRCLTCTVGLGEILEKVKICTWKSGSHFFGSKIQF